MSGPASRVYFFKEIVAGRGSKHNKGTAVDRLQKLLSAENLILEIRAAAVGRSRFLSRRCIAVRGFGKML